MVIVAALLVGLAVGEINPVSNVKADGGSEAQQECSDYFDGLLTLCAKLNFGWDNSQQDAEDAAEVEEVEELGYLTVIELGKLGSYHAVFDSNMQKWTLGIWPESQTERGSMDLAQLKIEGGVIQFTMPFNGTVNNSAGRIYVNDQLWKLGNPAKDLDGNPLIKKGDIVHIEYAPRNDSAGFQIWFSSK